MTKIKELRIKRGLSQKQLAELSGVSIQMISATEVGKRTPSFRLSHKLSQILGVTMEELIE